MGPQDCPCYWIFILCEMYHFIKFAKSIVSVATSVEMLTHPPLKASKPSQTSRQKIKKERKKIFKNDLTPLRSGCYLLRAQVLWGARAHSKVGLSAWPQPIWEFALGIDIPTFPHWVEIFCKRLIKIIIFVLGSDTPLAEILDQVRTLRYAHNTPRTHGNWKIKILGAVLELLANQCCQFSLFGPFLR